VCRSEVLVVSRSIPKAGCFSASMAPEFLKQHVLFDAQMPLEAPTATKNTEPGNRTGRAIAAELSLAGGSVFQVIGELRLAAKGLGVRAEGARIPVWL
jgi:hypothetical protein